MWLDRKQLNNLNGKMKLNDLKKRAHWNFRDDEYEPPTHLSDDVVEPDQDTLHDIVDRYKSTKSFLMEYGRTRMREQIINELRNSGVTDNNNRAINTFANLNDYIKRTEPLEWSKDVFEVLYERCFKTAAYAIDLEYELMTELNLKYRSVQYFDKASRQSHNGFIQGMMVVAKCELVKGIQDQQKNHGIVIKKKLSNNAGEEEKEFHKRSRDTSGFDEEVHIVNVLPKGDRDDNAALKRLLQPLQKKIRTAVLDGSIDPVALEHFIDENLCVAGVDGTSGKCESLGMHAEIICMIFVYSCFHLSTLT
jgi:hypothetical protein